MIREAKLRATASRVAVLRLLHGTSSPTSHPEICEALQSDGWDRATLFRNLVDLTKAGILRKRDLGDRLWRYELASASEDAAEHPHFLCTVCGDVSCLPEIDVAMLAGSGPQSLRTGQVEIQFRGTCDACLD
ncbi:MAG: transcriptional repressor [Myxococcota bacterium]